MAMTENADLYATAASLQGRRRSAEAERLYRRLVQQAHASEPEYDEWMRGLVETYRSMGRLREAGYVLLYLGRFAEAHQGFTTERASVEAARARDLWARSMPVGQAE